MRKKVRQFQYVVLKKGSRCPSLSQFLENVMENEQFYFFKMILLGCTHIVLACEKYLTAARKAEEPNWSIVK